MHCRTKFDYMMPADESHSGQPLVISEAAWTLSPRLLTPPVHLSKTGKFSGDSGDCRTFIAQCELHYEFQAACFPNDRTRIAFMIFHLTGRAKKRDTSETFQ